ncbi:hypothetical protein [Aeromonas veronii]|uniref:hypothetical protein n=1 Tax=Aeromonas veronii TaxID=654 RepID=UPI000E1F5A6C|nr:hypothetical protein [Aeromonas veronii]RDU80945.1 hypothetical protein CHF44_12960 [Aeromonas veronii]RDU88352.1 hypothetical protein CHH34_20555 [Aeromonas veronii]
MIVFVYPPDWVFVLLIIGGVLYGIAWVCVKWWRWFTDPERRKAALIRSAERAEQLKRDKLANSIRIEEAKKRLASAEQSAELERQKNAARWNENR